MPPESLLLFVKTKFVVTSLSEFEVYSNSSVYKLHSSEETEGNKLKLFTTTFVITIAHASPCYR
jgi:hypothetical protein